MQRSKASFHKEHRSLQLWTEMLRTGCEALICPARLHLRVHLVLSVSDTRRPVRLHKDRARNVLSSTQVSVWTARWSRPQPDSLAAVCLQIVQTVSFHFWKQRVSMAFWKQFPPSGKTHCHNAHVLLRISKKRDTFDAGLYSVHPNQPHIWQVWVWGWGWKGAGEHDFPFHVTVSLQYILE